VRKTSARRSPHVRRLRPGARVGGGVSAAGGARQVRRLRRSSTGATLMTGDLCFLTATELARRIRAREVSVTEVVQAHLAQIDRVNPRVNAVVTLIADRALDDAREKDAALARGEAAGPLFGLPIAHKDLVPTRGVRTTYGSPIYRDHVPDEDALIVER